MNRTLQTKVVSEKETTPAQINENGEIKKEKNTKTEHLTIPHTLPGVKANLFTVVANTCFRLSVKFTIDYNGILIRLDDREKTMQKVVSVPGTECTCKVPALSCMICRERLSPIPNPFSFVVKNGTKI